MGRESYERCKQKVERRIQEGHQLREQTARARWLRETQDYEETYSAVFRKLVAETTGRGVSQEEARRSAATALANKKIRIERRLNDALVQVENERIEGPAGAVREECDPMNPGDAPQVEGWLCDEASLRKATDCGGILGFWGRHSCTVADPNGRPECGCADGDPVCRCVGGGVPKWCRCRASPYLTCTPYDQPRHCGACVCQC